MKRGEKVVIAVIVVVVLGLMGRNLWRIETDHEKDKGIPYYSTASATLAREASDIYRRENCKGCHSLWTVRDMLESVPAPILDGIGSLRNEEWFYQYFSAPNPQEILPSRLKQEYRMRSYAQLPEHERRLLASYMASLKVQDWYLEETRKAEYEKLTGKEYRP
ncbi:MAG: c-type cytochrome [Nitrosomonadales bacterium]|nr:c-type cytochrome [Nitrosomonadales bacterium]